MEAAARCNIGACRMVNQDRVFSSQEAVGSLPNLYIVADGMGGHAAGERASTETVDFCVQFIKDAWPGNTGEIFCEMAEAVNRHVYSLASSNAELSGMGTTLVGMILRGTTLWVVNVGDSRAYHITKQAIRRITRDHSVVEDLVAKGDLTPEQARNHPQKNLITRALGTARRVKADLFQETVAEGDYLLLCSDGLINEVTDQEIHREVLAGGTPQEICQRLMTRTLDSGAPDNVTVVLFQL